MGWRWEGNTCGKTRGSLLWVLVMRERFRLDCVRVNILVVIYVCKMSSPGEMGKGYTGSLSLCYFLRTILDSTIISTENI